MIAGAAPDGLGGSPGAAPVEDWHEWRRGGIGGSDIASVIGLSRYGSAWTVWAEKVGLLPPWETTRRQRVGQLLEPAIGQLFTEETGLVIVGEQTWCEHPDLKWPRCTVDGFVAETPDAALVDVLGTHEIKTDARFGWPDGIPDNIRAQVVWQMGVTQSERAWLSVLHGGFNYELHEVEWDADALADWDYMLERGGELWDRVLSGDPPPPDGSEATQRAMAAVWPTHEDGVRVDLDDLHVELDERRQLKDDEKAVTARLREIDNVLRARFGSAEVGVIDGVPVLTYRSSERRGYVVQPTTVRSLRAATRRDVD